MFLEIILDITKGNWEESIQQFMLHLPWPSYVTWKVLLRHCKHIHLGQLIVTMRRREKEIFYQSTFLWSISRESSVPTMCNQEKSTLANTNTKTEHLCRTTFIRILVAPVRRKGNYNLSYTERVKNDMVSYLIVVQYYIMFHIFLLSI